VNVTLGDQVFIDAEGIEAKLAGNVLLTFRSMDSINAKGQVDVVKGKYKRRGIDLDIDRGYVTFNNGPVDLGALDVRAVRKIHNPKEFNDIRAGVAITGTIRSPQVKLYSEPAMSKGDTISYALFGKPQAKGDKTAQAGYILQAAGMFLSKDKTDSAQSQIEKILGLDTIEVHTEEGKDTLSGSIVTVGKYLSPDLYVAFGRSLFSGDNIVTTRYSFLKNWEIEGVKKGVNTGADLYYRVEFR
jgi:translocation and assembly module TamB